MKSFSVIIPSFNSSEFIKDSIMSVIYQSFSDFEVLVIDNASSDRTIEIIKDIRDERIRIISERDDGIYDAMNKGVLLARGKYVHILNSDDKYSSSEVLQNVISEFDKNPNIAIIYSGIRYVSRLNGKLTRYWIPSEFSQVKLRIGWHPPHPGVFVRRDVFQRSGGFKTNFGVTGDFDWLLRVFKDELTETKRLNKICVDMRLGGASDKDSLTKVRGLKNVFRIHKTVFNSSSLALMAVFYRVVSKLIMKMRGILSNG